MHRHEAGRCRPSRTRTTALRSYHPPPSRGRTGREEEERRRKNYMVKRGRCARKRPLDGTWTNPSQDGERPPREEWPIAMKILTGTVALADRSSRSFYYRFFSLLLFFPSSVLQYPSPTFRERFTKTAYNTSRLFR